MAADKKYTTFRSFYNYYLTEHADSKNRMFHFIGTAFLLICFITGIITGKWWVFTLIPLLGYGFAWVGHFFIEKNRPATFTYPVYSLAGDFFMFWHMITGRINKKLTAAKYAEKNIIENGR